MTDILVIGGGPAGLTAALYAARAGKSVTVCEFESLGGQITQSHQVDNYPGVPGIGGMELGDRLCGQAMEAGAEIAFTQVTGLRRTPEGVFEAETGDGMLSARAVIFAAGARPRLLETPGEAELTGRGVSYCALCDGAFFRGQDVAVVGGGSTAFSDALYLARLCRSVTVVHRRNAFRAEEALVRAARETPNLRFLTPYTVAALHGQDRLEAMTLRHTESGREMRLPVQGAFAAIGRLPDSSLVAAMADTDGNGYIRAGEDCRTRTPGLFAAGDCRAKAIRQLTTATADGTAAAVAACEYLDTAESGHPL